MINLFDLFSRDDYEWALAEGLVAERLHPTLPYRLLTYTPEAQYRNVWIPVTNNCRGLIINQYDEIIARPWRKFFNFGQVNMPFAFDAPVEVTDKMDGSLGILYPEFEEMEGALRNVSIATRGSFTSDQAIKANKMLQQYSFNAAMTRGWTFLVEIVYPENRIVLDYKGMEELVLLGAVNIDGGHYIGPGEAKAYLEWDGPTTEVMPYNRLADAVSAPDRANAEGMVVRAGREMLKLKQADYLELHKIVTNLSVKTVYTQLAAGRTLQDISKDIPDEWHGWLKDVAQPMIDAARKVRGVANEDYYDITPQFHTYTSRADFARVAKDKTYPDLMFMLYDDKPIGDAIWKKIDYREFENDKSLTA